MITCTGGVNNSIQVGYWRIAPLGAERRHVAAERITGRNGIHIDTLHLSETPTRRSNDPRSDRLVPTEHRAKRVRSAMCEQRTRDTEWATDPTTAAASTVIIHIIASMRMRDDAAAFGWIVDAVCYDLRATRRQRKQSEHMCGAYQHTVSRRGVPAGGICTIMVHRTEKDAIEHSWLHIAGCIVCKAGRSDGNHEQHGSWSCRSRAASSSRGG